jgi:hypothetical protein
MENTLPSSEIGLNLEAIQPKVRIERVTHPTEDNIAKVTKDPISGKRWTRKTLDFITGFMGKKSTSETVPIEDYRAAEGVARDEAAIAVLAEDEAAKTSQDRITIEDQNGQPIKYPEAPKTPAGRLGKFLQDYIALQVTQKVASGKNYAEENPEVVKGICLSTLISLSSSLGLNPIDPEMSTVLAAVVGGASAGYGNVREQGILPKVRESFKWALIMLGASALIHLGADKLPTENISEVAVAKATIDPVLNVVDDFATPLLAPHLAKAQRFVQENQSTINNFKPGRHKLTRS